MATNNDKTKTYAKPELTREVPASVPSLTFASPQEVGTRIDEVARSVGGVPMLAEVTEISESQLYRYIRGESETKTGAIVTIAAKTGYRVEWLVTGALPRLQSEYPQGGNATRMTLEEEDGPAYLPIGFVMVPRYDVRAAAGRGAVIESEARIGVYAYEAAWLAKETKADPANLAVVGVVGNSMEPEIYDGDEVMADLSIKRFVGDGIYLVRLEGGLIIKQLQRMVGGGLRIVSRNERYESQTIHERAGEYGTDFAILGRVLGKPAWVKL